MPLVYKYHGECPDCGEEFEEEKKATGIGNLSDRTENTWCENCEQFVELDYYGSEEF